MVTAAKVSTVVGAMSAVAAGGLPMALGLAVMLVVVIGAVCWVVADQRRIGNLAELIHAARGTASALPTARSRARTLPAAGPLPATELPSDTKLSVEATRECQ